MILDKRTLFFHIKAKPALLPCGGCVITLEKPKAQAKLQTTSHLFRVSIRKKISHLVIRHKQSNRDCFTGALRP